MVVSRFKANMKANDKRTLPRTGQQLTLLGLGCAPLGDLCNAISDVAALVRQHENFET